MVSPDVHVCEILFLFSYCDLNFQVAIESVLLIEDPKVARQVMFQNPPAKARMVSLGSSLISLCCLWMDLACKEKSLIVVVLAGLTHSLLIRLKQDNNKKSHFILFLILQPSIGEGFTLCLNRVNDMFVT